MIIFEATPCRHQQQHLDTIMDENEARDRHELAVEIEALEALRQQAGDQPRADRLPLDMVLVKEDVFQARLGDLDEKHLNDLRKALKSAKDLSPILVMPVSDQFVLIDGHHRREAYKLEGYREIPVEHFSGTAQEALLESGRRNSQAVLPLDNNQRQNYAWRLVCTGVFKKREIQLAAGVSYGQVGNMREVLSTLGGEAEDFDQWWQARQRFEEIKNGNVRPEFTAADLEERAQGLADRIVKAISTKPANNPEIMARALQIYLGRKADEVCTELQYLLDPGAREVEEYDTVREPERPDDEY